MNIYACVCVSMCDACERAMQVGLYLVCDASEHPRHTGAGDDKVEINSVVVGAGSLDGGAGSDKEYGNQGEDILQATDDAHSTPAVDSTAELSSKDLLSGGSGDDVLIDMANKSAAGKVVMLGGSGEDKISVDSDRSNLDYSGTHRSVLPFDEEDSVVRKIQTKIVDLSKSDKLDTSAIDKLAVEIADAIDIDLIDFSILSKKEKNYLFKYHMETYLNLSKYLNHKEKKWLQKLI